MLRERVSRQIPGRGKMPRRPEVPQGKVRSHLLKNPQKKTSPHSPTQRFCLHPRLQSKLQSKRFLQHLCAIPRGRAPQELVRRTVPAKSRAHHEHFQNPCLLRLQEPVTFARLSSARTPTRQLPLNAPTFTTVSASRSSSSSGCPWLARCAYRNSRAQKSCSRTQRENISGSTVA